MKKQQNEIFKNLLNLTKNKKIDEYIFNITSDKEKLHKISEIVGHKLIDIHKKLSKFFDEINYDITEPITLFSLCEFIKVIKRQILQMNDKLIEELKLTDDHICENMVEEIEEYKVIEKICRNYFHKSVIQTIIYEYRQQEKNEEEK